MKTSKPKAGTLSNTPWTFIVIGAILLIPLLAMQFSDQVSWSTVDFIAASILLLGAGFAYEFLVKKARDTKYRLVFAGAVVVVLALIWIEMAVGIFNSPISGS